MHVGVLGPLLVRMNGHDVTPRGQRLRNVFVALLQRRGRPVPAEVLLDLVWDGHAAGLSATAVHTAVARLRRQLGPGAITSDDLGYRIGSGVATDEEGFVQLVGQAREELRQGDAASACECLRRALGLWRGDQAFADVPAEFVEADRARSPNCGPAPSKSSRPRCSIIQMSAGRPRHSS
jgi:two-component SAPR family response regulator